MYLILYKQFSYVYKLITLQDPDRLYSITSFTTTSTRYKKQSNLKIKIGKGLVIFHSSKQHLRTEFQLEGSDKHAAMCLLL